jgi:hypothetical protein
LYISTTGSATLLKSISYTLAVGDELKVVTFTNNTPTSKVLCWAEVNGVRVIGPLKPDPGGVLLPDGAGILSQCAAGETLTWSYWSGGFLQYARRMYLDTINTDAPLSFWRMDASAGTSETDTRTAANNGTYAGTPTLNATGAITEDTDAAVTFNGSSQKMTASPTIANSSDQSIEMWFKSGGNASAATLFDVTTTGGLTLKVSAGDGEFQFVSGGTTVHGLVALVVGSWYHVVGTLNHTSGAMVLYVNGVSVGTGTGTATSITTCSVGANIAGSAWAKGTFDEIALYNSLLTAARVLFHYEVGLGIAV